MHRPMLRALKHDIIPYNGGYDKSDASPDVEGIETVALITLMNRANVSYASPDVEGIETPVRH